MVSKRVSRSQAQKPISWFANYQPTAWDPTGESPDNTPPQRHRVEVQLGGDA
ncbi:MAG: hypothetical protein R3D66_00755 [Alphaproteobacteria bacterium]